MEDKKTLSRLDALRRVAEHKAKCLDLDERRENLEMLRIEWDSGLSGAAYDAEEDEGGFDLLYQQDVPEDVRRDIYVGEYGDVTRPRFDSALAVYFMFELRNRSNNYLLKHLSRMGFSVEQIVGKSPIAVSCPCCGADSLDKRHDWGICKVCWWEDDGTDNPEASLYYSGPNKGLTLTEARINFLVTGIYNPKREDLRKSQEPIEHYDRGRIFEIDSIKGIIFEKGTDWYAPLEPPHLKKGEAKSKVSLAGAGLRDWPPGFE